jgi:hypothetical protein
MVRTRAMTSSARFSCHRLGGLTIAMVDEATLTATTGRDNAAALLLVNYVWIAELMKLDALEVVSHLPVSESGAAKHIQVDHNPKDSTSLWDVLACSMCSTLSPLISSPFLFSHPFPQESGLQERTFLVD